MDFRLGWQHFGPAWRQVFEENVAMSLNKSTQMSFKSPDVGFAWRTNQQDGCHRVVRLGLLLGPLLK